MAKTGVALCITDLRLGGAERCLIQLATGLDRRRFDPVVYVLEPPPPREQAAGLEALRAAEIEVHFLDARRNGQIVRVIRELTRLLAAQQPLVMQSFLFHANLVGRIAARRAGVARVLSGIRVAEPGRRWRLWADRFTDRMVDRHVCVSRSVAQFAQIQGGLPAEKITVIPNSVDLRRFPAECPAERSSLGIAAGSEGRRIVCSIGRLEAQKGLAWLIDSAPAWLGPLPDTDLVLVGDGPLREQLEALCNKHGIAERVHFTGWRPDVPEILAASNLLVLPSAWEGMPNVVLEAMASGLPVVATDVEGVRELLGPLAESQTIGHGDTAALVEKVVGLLRNDHEGRQIGRENRRRCEEHFDIPRMVGAYQDLWESLLGD